MNLHSLIMLEDDIFRLDLDEKCKQGLLIPLVFLVYSHFLLQRTKIHTEEIRTSERSRKQRVNLHNNNLLDHLCGNVRITYLPSRFH